MRRFNVTGTCIGTEHYMVDISGKLDEIEKLVEKKHYFTINRARQYGKTTLLFHLAKRLGQRGGYIPVVISFESMGLDTFESEKAFCEVFLEMISHALTFSDAPEDYAKNWYDPNVSGIASLNRHITKMCKGKNIPCIWSLYLSKIIYSVYPGSHEAHIQILIMKMATFDRTSKNNDMIQPVRFIRHHKLNCILLIRMDMIKWIS